jgi:dTDP-4-amino-4,6-dideoxygalactose transaminase
VTKIPFFDLQRQFQRLQTEIMSDVEQVCESQTFILGPKVAELEQRIAAFSGARFGIGTSSGTDAQLLILMALGIGPGDAVITTPFTFFATASAVVRAGAKPVFVDIDPATLNLSAPKLREFLEKECISGEFGVRTRDGAKVRAVVPVHLFGLCSDLAQLRRLCAEWKLVLIEDAAQALGAVFPDTNGPVKAGSVGEAGFFSFYPTKNLGAFGDAGLVVTSDPDLANKLQIMRNHGMEPKYYHEVIGGNFRMDALQATVLLRKFNYLENWSQRRWDIAQRYQSGLAGMGLGLPVEPYYDSCGWRGHIYHQFVIRTARRDQLRAALNEQGIGTEIYYPLALHQQPCFRNLGYQNGDFPIAEQTAKECLALPIFPELTDDEQALVTLRIREFFAR